MKGSRPPQASLTANNDLSKTAETLAVIDSMVDGLNDHDIDQYIIYTIQYSGSHR